MENLDEFAIIIGAGPAGLTAAYELVEKSNIKPIIFEATDIIGGISQTNVYKGNRIDIGGHRFFSKSKVVMDWWMNILPMQQSPSYDDKILDKKLDYSLLNNITDVKIHEDYVEELDPEKNDEVLLIRNRISRILFLNKLFNYPVTLNPDTLKKLGVTRTLKIGFDYLKTLVHKLPEDNLKNFYINRFGEELYKTFFEKYTFKVWGVECKDISADWGAQRVKGLYISKTIIHAIHKLTKINEKNFETSLIEQFLYPKLGPGQMWETVAKKIVEKGGEIHLNSKVIGFETDGNDIKSVQVQNQENDEVYTVEGDHFVSTMPIRDLIHSINQNNPNAVPENVYDISQGLVYRDFITVGILLNDINLKNETDTPTINDILPDSYSNALSSNRNNKTSEKILIKEQNEKTKDTTTKTLGRKTKGSTEKGKHDSNSDDNQRDKRIRSLVAYLREIASIECTKCNVGIFEEPNIKKQYGSSFLQNMSFINTKLYKILCFQEDFKDDNISHRNKSLKNKTIIMQMLGKEKNDLFVFLMKAKLSEYEEIGENIKKHLSLDENDEKKLIDFKDNVKSLIIDLESKMKDSRARESKKINYITIKELED